MNSNCFLFCIPVGEQFKFRKDSYVYFVSKHDDFAILNSFCISAGQIATNEALKKDLESIIIGLQEYLESVKCQAKQANDECKELQKDKESLLQRLTDLQEERNNLEVVAMDAENMKKVRLGTMFLPKFRLLGINLKLSKQSNKKCQNVFLWTNLHSGSVTSVRCARAH